MKIFKKNELVTQIQDMQIIPVRDLKEYLIKDFEQIQQNEVEISKLKDRIDELEKIEIKYKATLITLEEFDTRIAREKENVIKIETKYTQLKEEMKKLEEQKNNCIIREKQALDKINNVKDVILKEYREKLIFHIQNSKGTLSKKKVCEIIENN